MVHAEVKASVSGKVVDKTTNIPLEYATVSFMEPGQQDPIYGGITNENGQFSIDVESGTYTIKIEFIGYKPFLLQNKKIEKHLDLETIYLIEDIQSLDNVIVEGEKRLVVTKLDKKIYNVDKDLTTRGANALQVLNNVPSLSVSVNGGVVLRGNSNVRVLLNGKPSGLIGISTTKGLERLPSNTIESIEVITNPSARYDAEGASGIINIILKKGKALGVNGSVQTVLGIPENYGVTGSLNYRTENFNIFTNVALGYSKRPGNRLLNTTYFDDSTGGISEVLNQKQRVKRGGPEYIFVIGADYYFNHKNTLTFMGLYAREDNNNNGSVTFNTFNTDNQLISTRLRGEKEKEDDKSDEYTLTYKAVFDEDEEHSLTIEAKYNSNTEIESAAFKDTWEFGDFQEAQDRTATNEKQKNLLLQVDYIFPFSKSGQFEAGCRSNLRRIKYNSTVEEFNNISDIWELNTNLSNRMDYSENIHAFYSQYTNTFGKFKLLAGLRLELTHIDITQFTSNISFGKNYGNVFPSFHLGYELTENSEFKTSYGRRVQRPDFRALNPFSGFSDNLNLYSGNPDLNPVFTNIFELGHSKKWDDILLETTGYYQHSEDIIQRLTTHSGMVSNTIPVLITRPLNVGNEHRFGIELSSLYSLTKWFQVNGTINGFSFKQKGHYQNPIEDTDNPGSFIAQNVSINTSSSSWFARILPKVKLPGEIDIQIALQYDAPFKESNITTKDMFVASASINKELFQGRGSLNFNAIDILNSRKRRQNAFNTSFWSYSETQRSEGQFNLTFTYRFREFKESEPSDDDNF